MEFYSLAKTNELSEGFRRSVQVAGMKVLIFFHEGELHIIEDRCPHMDVPLETATIESNLIRCRAHGIGFNLASGKAEGMWRDTLDCLKKFEPIYRDYSVGVEI